jgi:hypothetical protein
MAAGGFAGGFFGALAEHAEDAAAQIESALDSLDGRFPHARPGSASCSRPIARAQLIWHERKRIWTSTGNGVTPSNGATANTVPLQLHRQLGAEGLNRSRGNLWQGKGLGE